MPGVNLFGTIPGFVDQPVFAEGVARFRGEAVAAVVGTAEVMAQFDPARFPVEWEILPDVQGMVEAMAQDAPQLHSGRAGNVMCGGFVAHGDVGAALERAHVVAEGEFETGFVEHAYIEPEAGFAQVVEGRVEVHACTQAPVMDLDTLEQVLGMERSRIRVVPTATGGGLARRHRCVGAALSGDCRAQDRATGADHL